MRAAATPRVQAVKMLSERSGGFRVLALSATPGRDPMAVQQVSATVGVAVGQ